MTKIINLEQIKEICLNIDFAPLIEEGFAGYPDGRAQGRTADDQLTVADLTGAAVQDMQIAKAVCTGFGTEE